MGISASRDSGEATLSRRGRAPATDGIGGLCGGGNYNELDVTSELVPGSLCEGETSPGGGASSNTIKGKSTTTSAIGFRIDTSLFLQQGRPGGRTPAGAASNQLQRTVVSVAPSSAPASEGDEDEGYSSSYYSSGSGSGTSQSENEEDRRRDSKGSGRSSSGSSRVSGSAGEKYGDERSSCSLATPRRPSEISTKAGAPAGVEKQLSLLEIKNQARQSSVITPSSTPRISPVIPIKIPPKKKRKQLFLVPSRSRCSGGAVAGSFSSNTVGDHEQLQQDLAPLCAGFFENNAGWFHLGGITNNLAILVKTITAKRKANSSTSANKSRTAQEEQLAEILQAAKKATTAEEFLTKVLFHDYNQTQDCFPILHGDGPLEFLPANGSSVPFSWKNFKFPGLKPIPIGSTNNTFSGGFHCFQFRIEIPKEEQSKIQQRYNYFNSQCEDYFSWFRKYERGEINSIPNNQKAKNIKELQQKAVESYSIPGLTFGFLIENERHKSNPFFRGNSHGVSRTFVGIVNGDSWSDGMRIRKLNHFTGIPWALCTSNQFLTCYLPAVCQHSERGNEGVRDSMYFALQFGNHLYLKLWIGSEGLGQGNSTACSTGRETNFDSDGRSSSRTASTAQENFYTMSNIFQTSNNLNLSVRPILTFLPVTETTNPDSSILRIKNVEVRLNCPQFVDGQVANVLQKINERIEEPIAVGSLDVPGGGWSSSLTDGVEQVAELRQSCSGDRPSSKNGSTPGSEQNTTAEPEVAAGGSSSEQTSATTSTRGATPSTQNQKQQKKQTSKIEDIGQRVFQGPWKCSLCGGNNEPGSSTCAFCGRKNMSNWLFHPSANKDEVRARMQTEQRAKVNKRMLVSDKRFSEILTEQEENSARSRGGAADSIGGETSAETTNIFSGELELSTCLGRGGTSTREDQHYGGKNRSSVGPCFLGGNSDGNNPFELTNFKRKSVFEIKSKRNHEQVSKGKGQALGGHGTTTTTSSSSPNTTLVPAPKKNHKRNTTQVHLSFRSTSSSSYVPHSEQELFGRMKINRGTTTTNTPGANKASTRTTPRQETKTNSSARSSSTTGSTTGTDQDRRLTQLEEYQKRFMHADLTGEADKFMNVQVYQMHSPRKQELLRNSSAKSSKEKTVSGRHHQEVLAGVQRTSNSAFDRTSCIGVAVPNIDTFLCPDDEIRVNFSATEGNRSGFNSSSTGRERTPFFKAGGSLFDRTNTSGIMSGSNRKEQDDDDQEQEIEYVLPESTNQIPLPETFQTYMRETGTWVPRAEFLKQINTPRYGNYSIAASEVDLLENHGRTSSTYQTTAVGLLPVIQENSATTISGLTTPPTTATPRGGISSTA
eukprot:GSA120T00008846001.1